MSHIIVQISARCIYLVAFVSVNYLACSNGSEYIAAIPGTEAVTRQGSDWNISVSPDERWLAFWELNRGIEHPYDAHLCMIDLNTFNKIAHRIDSLDVRAFTYGGLLPWPNIASNFRAACWNDDQCYVVLRFRPAWKCVVFTAGVIEGRPSAIPANLTCSDCVPTPRVESIVTQLVGRSLLDYGRLYSIAYENGALGKHLYHVGNGASIVKSDTVGSETVIAYPPSRFKNFDIVALRVSPNERYLAYGLFLKLRSRVPLPDQKIELHVYDLAEDKDHNISSGYRYLSNLIWSSDSGRLYFAGFRGEERAIYQVEVSAVLEGR